MSPRTRRPTAKKKGREINDEPNISGNAGKRPATLPTKRASKRRLIVKKQVNRLVEEADHAVKAAQQLAALKKFAVARKKATLTAPAS